MLKIDRLLIRGRLIAGIIAILLIGAVFVPMVSIASDEDVEVEDVQLPGEEAVVDEELLGTSSREDGNSLRSVEIQPNATEGKDAWITNSSNGANNYGDDPRLIVGNDGDGSGTEYRSLIQFDLNSDIGELEYATLKLYSQGYYNRPNVTVKSLSNHWVEGTGSSTPNMAVNWTHRTNTEEWGTDGGDYYNTPSSYRRCDMTGIWYSWDVTEIVEYWLNGARDNNGFMLAPDHYVDSYDWIRFHSSDYSDPELHPKLVLSYAPFPDKELDVNDPPQVTDLSEKEYGPMTHQAAPCETGTGYPFGGGVYDQLHYQSVYRPEQVGAEGRISRLSINRTTLTSGNFSNFNISLAHTNLDNLTSTFADNYIGNLIGVFSEENVEINSSNGDSWVHFDLDGSFIYDPSYNLLVDIQWHGDGGTSISSHVKWDNDVKRVWSTDGGATVTTNPNLPSYRFTTEVLHNSVVDAGTSRLSHPFYGSASVDYSKIQMLYHSSELSGREGYIDHLSIHRDNMTTYVATYPNLTISLAHTNLDSLTDTYEDNYQGDLVEVYNVSTFTFESGYGWVDIDIDNEFIYDGTDNLLVELTWQGDAGGDYVYLEYKSEPEDRSLRNYSESPTGDLYSFRYNMRFSFENEWEAQSLNPELFEAGVDGQELTIRPQPNEGGMGTLALTMTNAYPGPLTRDIIVNIRMKDTFIWSEPGQEYNNYGGYYGMYAGKNNGHTLRSLLEFNLPAEEGALTRASVSMYCFGMDVSSNVNVSLSPITNEWLENDLTEENGAANWHNRTTGTAWDTEGGDFDTSYTSYRNISQTGTWYDWDITEIVRAWYNGDMENYGLMITGNDYGTDNYAAFGTSDVFGGDDYWPKISISFGPEHIPPQTMNEDDPTRSLPLSTDYPSITQQSGPLNETNYWPFYGSRATCHYQTLYTPNQVGAEGDIESISIKRESMDVGQFSDLSISMAHTSVSSLSTTYANNYEGFLVEVYSAAQYEANSSDGDLWLTFDLNGNFTYDSSHNLLLDIKWNGSSGTVVPTNETADFSEFRRVWGDLGSSTGLGRDYDTLTVKFETEFTDNGILYSGTSSNFMPFSPEYAEEQRLQMLYKDEDLNCSGMIDKLYFQGIQIGIDWSVMENFTLKLAHSTNETLDTSLDQHNSSPLVEVMNYSVYNVTSHSRTDWIELDLDNSFNYNGVDNLLIDFSYKGGYGGDNGVNLAVVSGASYQSRAWEIPPNPPGTSATLYNIVVEMVDNPYWASTSSDPSLFTTGISMGPNLDITPQPDQFGSGTIDLRMMNCNGHLVTQQNVPVTINPMNDAPDAPVDPSPVYGATGISLSPTLSVNVSDIDGDSMDVTFYDASDDSVIDTDSGVANGSTASVTWSGLSYGQTYDWYAIANDTQVETQSSTWSFTTLPNPNDEPDEPIDPSPGDGDTGVSTSPTLSVNVSDPNGDSLTVHFYDASDDSEIGNNTGVTNGTTSITWSGLATDTTYSWYAVADDGEFTNQSATWSFTTIVGNTAPDAPTDPSPGDGASDVSTSPTLSVNVSDPDGDTMTVIFYNASDDSVIDTDNNVADGEMASVTWSGLAQGTVYNWYAVANDSQAETSSSEWSFTTTSANYAPDAPTNPSPADGATDVNTSPTLSVDVSDPDGDSMNVTFYDASDDSIIGTDNNVADGGTAEADWTGLSESTEYQWYTLADDGMDTAQSPTWTFTTGAGNSAPDAPTNPSPTDGATGVSTSPTLSVDVTDSNGDSMDVTFYDASDDSIIGTDSGVADGGTAEVVWSSLDLDTEYTWYAIANDSQAETTSAQWSFTTTADNHAPAQPSNPSPEDGATSVGISPTLSVDVSDNDGDSMNVTFYDASDDTVIGTDENVADGNTASVTWSGLSEDTEYNWYAVADDRKETSSSPMWSFTTQTGGDTEPPEAVADADETVISPGDTVSFDGSGSTDNVGVVNYTWSIGGETYTGDTAEHTFEELGNYTVTLTVKDTAGNSDSDTLYVRAIIEEDDWDGDGMPNDWEDQYDLDPWDPSDADEDEDDDGYKNLKEYKEETDPTDADDHPGEEEGLGMLLYLIPIIIVIIVIVGLLAWKYSSGAETSSEETYGEETYAEEPSEEYRGYEEESETEEELFEDEERPEEPFE